MSDRHTDDTLREIEPIDRAALVSTWSNSEAKQALFQEITAMPGEAPARPRPSTRQRPSRRAVLIAATLGVMALGTGAGALSLLAPTSQDTATSCHTTDGSSAIIQATTGDPVVDCQAYWSEILGGPAPDMIAYDNGRGGIEVLPADVTPDQDWHALEPGPQQMPELIELEAALDDVADGLRSGCYTLDAAEPIVRREFDRLGLEGWTVVSERGEADGTDTCTYFYLSGLQHHVVLVPTEGTAVAPGEPVAKFAAALSEALSNQCMTTAEAAVAVAEFADDAGLTGAQLSIREVIDPGTDCSRAEVNPGGVYRVTVRGPAA